MSIESHSIISGGNQKERKENAKENGIWRKLSDEEYEREKAKIKVRLEEIDGLVIEEKGRLEMWFHSEEKGEVT